MEKDSLIPLILFNLFLILLILLFGCERGGGEGALFEYDKNPPLSVIVNAPPVFTNSTDAFFEFRCNENNCLFKCRIDSEDWNDCSGSIAYSSLSEGVHTFYVYAIDGNGNIEKTPSTYIWTIDITPPQVTLVEKPSDSTVKTSATFEFVCNETNCRYECSIDGSDWTDCKSPIQYSGLFKGNHVFSVKAEDEAGNQSQVEEFSWNIIATVISVYPFDGQVDVPLTTSIFLTFSEEIDETTLLNGFMLSADSASVAGTLEVSSEKRSAKFIPATPLSPKKSYYVILNDVKTADGISLTLKSDGIVSNFMTVAERVKSGDGLSVIAVEPGPENFYDFSTIRILLSENINPSSVIKGSSFILKSVSDDSQVSGSLFVSGNRIIFDPDTDLVPGEEYRLELTNDIRAVNGEQLTPYTLSIYPIRTVPFMELVNDTYPDIDDVGGDPNLLPISDFTGARVNSSIIDSRLLGASLTYLKGLLKAEVRIPLNGSDALTVVMRKGQIIGATGVDIKLGGKIDTLLDTGDILLYLITDSSGYIVTNPLADINNDATPAIYLNLDTCITATDMRVNSILNQNLMNIGLYGEVTIQGDTMVIDAFGTTELSILGAEKAPVTLTLRLKGSSQSVPIDTSPPAVSSIYPPGEDNVSVDSPVIITFSEPVKESTLAGRITVTFGPSQVPGNLIVNGTSVIFKPNNQFMWDTVYTVRVSQGIEDLNGNTLQTEEVMQFRTEVFNSGNLNALLVGSIYPGVPCILINPNPSPPGNAGECYVRDHDIYKFSKFELPINKNINVIFTKPVNPASVNDASFVVTDKSTSQPVLGSRIVSYKNVIFIPDEPWIIGREYELRLVGGTNTICDAGEICGTDGRPLNTDILFDAGSGGEGVSQETPGGGNAARSAIVIPFIGSAFSRDIDITLQLSRFSDTNSNGVRDTSGVSEPSYLENSATLTTLGVINLTTYLSGTLLTKIKEYNSDPSHPDTIPMKIPPGNWMFGTEIYFSLLITIDTDRTIMRPAMESAGYIMSPDPSDPDQRPIVEITMRAWMNAVNDNNGEAYLQDETNTEFIMMTLRGRIAFTSDGRMIAELSNPADITGIEMTVPLLGQLPATINAGNLRVRAVTLPVKR